MNCERVQALVSARMDGVYLTASQAEATDVHVGGCARCRAFEERSARVRTAVRIRPAEQVPVTTSLTGDIRKTLGLPEGAVVTGATPR